MTAIFDDETAGHVREDYRELLEGGRTGSKATDELMEDYEDLLADPDQAPMVWIGLAATQLELGEVEPRVKERALEAIDAGGAFSRRRPLAEAAREQRRAAVADLRERLAPPARPSE